MSGGHKLEDIGELKYLGMPSIEFGPLFYTQVIVGLTPTIPTNIFIYYE